MKDFNVNLDDVANWLEVVGFILSIFTVVKVWIVNKEVKRLSAKHLLLVRVNEHLKELKLTSNLIVQHLRNFSQQRRELKLIVSNSLANSRSLLKKVDKNDLPSLLSHIELSKKIKSRRRHQGNESFFDKMLGRTLLSEKDIDDYYESINLLIREVEQLTRDNKMSLR